MNAVTKKGNGRIKMLNKLYRIAAKEDILIDEQELKTAAAASVMDEDGYCMIGLNPDRLHGEGEKAVALAHEIGHCVKGAFYNLYSPLDLRSRHEYRADCWACENLVSREELLCAFHHGNTEAWELSEYFGIPQDYIVKIVNHYFHQ